MGSFKPMSDRTPPGTSTFQVRRTTRIAWRFERSELAHVDGTALVESNELTEVVVIRVTGKLDMQSIAAPLIARDNVHPVEPCEEQCFVALVKVANAVRNES